MNFFGHAVVASWFEDDPAVALGAMLPDFAHMLGCRRIETESPTIARGVELHHRCDGVFHDSPTFLRLQASSRRELADAGVSSGPRLAIAHVGLELMLDSELSRESGHVAQYVKALKQGLARSDELRFVGNSRQGAAHELGCEFQALLTMLLERVEHLSPRTPEQLFVRLMRILARRPRLCPRAQDEAAVVAWAERMWPRLRTSLDGWLAEISAELGVGMPAGRSPLHLTSVYS